MSNPIVTYDKKKGLRKCSWETYLHEPSWYVGDQTQLPIGAAIC